MKTYRLILSAKIYITIISAFAAVFFIYFAISFKNEPAMLRILCGILGLLFPFGIYAYLTKKVVIYDTKIEVVPMPLIQRTGTLYWKDIVQVDTQYAFYPESGSIKLIPHISSGKKFIVIPVSGMPIDLLIDILSHVSPDTKISLYPYLEKRIEARKKGKLDIGIRS